MNCNKSILVNKNIIFSIILSISSLSGCAMLTSNVPPPLDKLEPIDPMRQKVVYCPATLFDLNKQRVKLNSKISIDANGQRFFGQMNWEHRPERDTFEFLSPFGQMIAKLSQDKNGVTLDDGKNTYHALTAEELTLRTFGWKMPVSGIVYWLIGRPYPFSGAIPQTNNQGQMMKIQQSGWDVIYFDDYAPAGMYLMPRTIEIFGQDQSQNSPIKIKIINQVWDFN